jgi:hypothetical protein
MEVVVTRHVSVALDKGRKADPRVEKLQVDASITPITGQDLKRLGELQRVEGTMLIITPSELFTAKSSPCRIADELHYKGIDYQISMVNDWYDMGGFYECVGTRKQR